jgi:N-acyl amino acid synthase of PEP-CTERM/exosortase system
MHRTFSYGLVDNSCNQKDVLRDIFSLRYQVYVNEWEFESADDHPSGLEYDEYDEYSVHHFARCKAESRVIGTARIILNSDIGLPISKHFEFDKHPENVEMDLVGEISRLAVSKEYRRRAIDRAIFGTGEYAPDRIPRYMDEGRDAYRHCEHELIRGLYMSIYSDSKRRGLTHWYAVMARGLYIILKRWGISFEQVGPAKDYHGHRAPYLVSIESVERALEKNNPELLEEARKTIVH